MQKLAIFAGATALALSLGLVAAQAQNSTRHTAASIACSKQADAKGLHGKAREHFRSKCKREYKHER